MPQIAQATDKVWPGCQARHIGYIPLFRRIILHGYDFAALGAHLECMVSLLNDTG